MKLLSHIESHSDEMWWEQHSAKDMSLNGDYDDNIDDGYLCKSNILYKKYSTMLAK